MKTTTFTLYWLFTILTFISLGLSYCGSSTSPENGVEFLADSYAEDFLKKRLKSPGIEKLPGLTENVNHIKALGNNEYLINSWVDSLNSFGALIRSNFSYRLMFEGENVKCLDLVIE